MWPSLQLWHLLLILISAFGHVSLRSYSNSVSRVRSRHSFCLLCGGFCWTWFSAPTAASFNSLNCLSWSPSMSPSGGRAHCQSFQVHGKWLTKKWSFLISLFKLLTIFMVLQVSNMCVHGIKFKVADNEIFHVLQTERQTSVLLQLTCWHTSYYVCLMAIFLLILATVWQTFSTGPFFFNKRMEFHIWYVHIWLHWLKGVNCTWCRPAHKLSYMFLSNFVLLKPVFLWVE